jgi:S-DNA-T family DNA segregation ATPase FtsK/SpoIIIE
MGSPSTASSKSREATFRFGPSLLDPHRLLELTGLVTGVCGLLVLLSLASYLPQDPSLNSTVPPGTVPHNWIGPLGAYTADALLQVFGWVAFLLPVALLIVGTRLLFKRPFEAPRTKLVGALLLIGSLGALLDLFPYTPTVHGALRGSGVLGFLVATGLFHLLNRIGAGIVALTAFTASLFLVTRFSFQWAAQFTQKHSIRALEPLRARWDAWKDARAEKAEALRRKKIDEDRAAGKRPVLLQKVVARKAEGAQPIKMPLPKSSAEDERPSAKKNAVEESAPPAVVMMPSKATPTAVKAPRIVGTGSQAYKLPSVTLLRPADEAEGIDEDELKERATRLTAKFLEFGVTGNVTQIHPGPVVTTFEFKPEAGIKYSRITNLVDDLCLAMKAESIIIDRIAGKSTVGIEVPNQKREIIHLRELVESSEFMASTSKISLGLGKDVSGKNRVGDLTQMPHLLIAGSTGSGKSVAINSIVVSVLMKSTPEEVKLILIDPKRIELNLYEGVPHLLTPIVTEPKRAANALRRAVMEMDDRLRKLAEHGVRNIGQYNKLFEPESNLSLFDNNGEREKPLPYIVIIIDELADLMMVEPQGVEEAITRLAQMARAVGIHLVLATQRPSVDVITGLIKANMPSRISFRVASKVDSRTILDSNGAEALLGRGDMLFLPPASSRLQRVHGALITESEIEKVVEWCKAQSQPQYNEEFLEPIHDKSTEEGGPVDEEESSELDSVYEDAVRIVVESGKASTSLLQRRLRLGYGRAARLIDMMERDGIVGSPDGSRPREVLKRPEWLAEVDQSLR